MLSQWLWTPQSLGSTSWTEQYDLTRTIGASTRALFPNHPHLRLQARAAGWHCAENAIRPWLKVIGALLTRFAVHACSALQQPRALLPPCGHRWHARLLHLHRHTTLFPTSAGLDLNDAGCVRECRPQAANVDAERWQAGECFCVLALDAWLCTSRVMLQPAV